MNKSDGHFEQMPREAYDRMLRDIAGGSTPVGEQAMEARWAAEQAVSKHINDTLGAFFFLVMHSISSILTPFVNLPIS